MAQSIMNVAFKEALPNPETKDEFTKIIYIHNIIVPSYPLIPLPILDLPRPIYYNKNSGEGQILWIH